MGKEFTPHQIDQSAVTDHSLVTNKSIDSNKKPEDQLPEQIALALRDINQFLDNYSAQMAARQSLTEYATPEEQAAIRTNHGLIRDSLADSALSLSAKLIILQRLRFPAATKIDLVDGAADSIAERNAKEAETFTVASYETLGTSVPDLEAARTNWEQIHSHALDERTKKQLRQLIASSESTALLKGVEVYAAAQGKNQDDYDWHELKKELETALQTEMRNELTQGFEQAREFYNKLPEGGPALRTRLAIYDHAALHLSTSERYQFLKEDLDRASRANSAKLRAELEATHGSETVTKTIEKIQKERFTTINVSFSTLREVVRTGRVKSSWEIKQREGTHDMRRHVYEQTIGIRATGSEQDPHPIYAAVAYGDHQKKQGAARPFGDCYLELKEDEVRQRGLFLYGDLGDTHLAAEHRDRQYNYEDAALARAKIELEGDQSKAPYIEVELLGHTNIDHVKAIHIPQSYVTEYADEFEALSQELPPTIKLIID